MVGVGAYFSGAEEDLRTFAEVTGIPVYSDFQAHGLLRAVIRFMAARIIRWLICRAEGQRPDLVLALGVRFGLFTLGMSDLVVPLAAKIIHVESDAKEIGRLRQVAVGIVADPRETLHALNARAKSEKWPDRSAWQRTVSNAKVERCKRAQADLNRPGTPIHPMQAVSAIVDNIARGYDRHRRRRRGIPLVERSDSPEHPGSYITHGFLGSVGYRAGAFAGRASGAIRSGRCCCLVGDGAIGFTIAEFDTMVRHKLPIVAVVMNNHSWAASQHFQEIVSGKESFAGN